VRVFSYKIVRDFGFAPNPFDQVCTLATCKPRLRKSAKAGDIIVGCGSTANGLAGRVICIQRVSGKCTFQEYWDNPRFTMKRPFFKGSRRRAYGDNIYHHDTAGRWIQEKAHHSFSDGVVNEENLAQDTDSDNVLWSDDFAYFGRIAPPIPEHLRNLDGDDLYPACRDYRANFPAAFVVAIDTWFRALSQRGYLGRPTSWT
jgi:putative DNA base modification enzyme with NMAD domain